MDSASREDQWRALEDAGLTRYEALATATRNPGALIQRTVSGSEPFGTIAVGSRADVILTEKNPLDDLATLREPLGVMANGKWYAKPDLQAMLADVADEYDSAFVSN